VGVAEAAGWWLVAAVGRSSLACFVFVAGFVIVGIYYNDADVSAQMP
jgi:hypothetical protein